MPSFPENHAFNNDNNVVKGECIFGKIEIFLDPETIFRDTCCIMCGAT